MGDTDWIRFEIANTDRPVVWWVDDEDVLHRTVVRVQWDIDGMMVFHDDGDEFGVYADEVRDELEDQITRRDVWRMPARLTLGYSPDSEMDRRVRAAKEA